MKTSEKKLLYAKEYRESHKKEAKVYRKNNREKMRIANIKWRKKNPERAAELSRRTSYKYWRKNRVRLNAERRERRKHESM